MDSIEQSPVSPQHMHNLNTFLPQSTNMGTQKIPSSPCVVTNVKTHKNLHTSTEADPKPKIKILKKFANTTATVHTGARVNVKHELTAEPIVVGQESGNISGKVKLMHMPQVAINKIPCSFAGIRKVIHIKKAPNQKSILLPVSFKNGSDIRAIKIVKSSSLTKSPKILLAASTLLQEYKQKELAKKQIMQEQNYGE